MKIKVVEESNGVSTRAEVWLSQDDEDFDDSDTINYSCDFDEYSNLFEYVRESLAEVIGDQFEPETQLLIKQSLNSQPIEQVPLSNGNFKSTWEIEINEYS